MKKLSNMTRNNHYVSQFYLKNWANEKNRVWRYSTLVSHKGVPEWKLCSPKGVAYQRDLYTRVTSDSESDRMEQWFEENFESPAVIPISKAISGARLTANDWASIIRYLAMQDVRTPARLAQHLQLMDRTIKKEMDDVVGEFKAVVESGDLKNLETVEEKPDEIAEFPLKMSQESEEGSELTSVSFKTVTGRGTWLWAMEHTLKNITNVLHKHKWTIMRPAKGVIWPTSDNPVIRLNYYKDGKYDFKGGWDNECSEFFFPIGPDHLIYTKIGSRSRLRGTCFNLKETLLIRKFIVESAYSMVFSNQKDKDIPNIKPRIVDAHRFRAVQKQWANWNSEQSEIERSFSK